jgi:hypothetical protein
MLYSGYFSDTSATLSLHVLCDVEVKMTSFVNCFVLDTILSLSVAIITLSAFDLRHDS